MLKENAVTSNYRKDPGGSSNYRKDPRGILKHTFGASPMVLSGQP